MVGYYNIFSSGAGGTLVESWNGTSWSVVPSPGSGDALNWVSCASASACMAAGYRYNANQYGKTLIESGTASG